IAGIDGATTAEYAPDAEHQVIDLMEEQKLVHDLGGSMRLGAFDCTLVAGSISREAYGRDHVSERHRHRYEFNNRYRGQLSEAGLMIAGVNQKLDLVEIIELPRDQHPWFVGVQFHPEFK